MYDLIVIGGGPAGLAATLYASRKKMDVLLVSPNLGGRTTQRLALPWVKEDDPAWKGLVYGLELADGLRREFEGSTIPRRTEGVEQVRKSEQGFTVSSGGMGGPEWEARAVIVATGTRHIPLNIPGEREYLMRGVSYSALSFAPFFAGRAAAVIGEGELALRSAAELSTLAKQVYLVCSPSCAARESCWRRH
jgi:thioredoxin reductase